MASLNVQCSAPQMAPGFWNNDNRCNNFGPSAVYKVGYVKSATIRFSKHDVNAQYIYINYDNE